MNDERFSHVGRDPKFRSMPRKLRKVKIDKRFNAMFKDNRFKLKYTVDKRGRPVNFSSSEDLKRYYDTNDNSDDDDDDEDEEASEEEDAEETEATTDAAAADEGGSDASEDEAAQASPVPDTSLPKPDKIKGKKSSKPKTDASSASKTPKTKAVKNRSKSDDTKTAKIGEDTIRSQPSKLKDSQTSKKKLKKKKQQQQQLPESDDEGEPLDEDVRGKLLDLAVDYARGGGVLAEDSSSDEESEPEEEELEHDWAELDRDADRIDDEEVTARLAVCNMDWDRIKAVDIMVLLHSFLPPGGVINQVTVYPSEFGKKKMAEEEERGPSELFNKEDAAGSSDDENDAAKEVSGEALEHSQMEHVRRYQLSRLRYYYAVVTCDSPATASKLYEECEGLEFESSASRVDLRFVPDDMTFDETPREECTSLPEAGRYQPSKFVTTALQQRLVRFTWDETDVDRQEAVRQAMEKGADADDANLRAYLADSSDESAGEGAGSEEEEEGAVSEKERIAKYRALLAGGDDGDDKEEDDVEMEITWGGVGIKEKTEEIVKKKEQEKNLTPWEKYIDKQKQKKKDDKKKVKPAAEEGSLDSDSGDGSDGDSDVPSDLAEDPFFKEELDARRKEADNQKKRKKKQGKTNGAGEEDTGDQDQLALLTMEDGEEDSRRHFNFKQIVKDETSSGKKKKWKKKRKPAAEAPQQDDFQVDVSDPRFAKLYDSANFNVDPSDTRFKRTSGMERLVKEKQRRVAAGETRLEEPEPKKSRTDKSDTAGSDSKPAEDLGALVSNIKSRAKHLARKKQNSAKR